MATLDVTKARDRVEDAAKTARTQLSGASHELADRASGARDELGNRADAAREALLERFDDVDLEPTIRRAKIGFWTSIRAVLGALLAVPRLLVRGLGGLADVADDAAERGSELSERSRELSARTRQLARQVPVTASARRRARARTAAWAVGGFAVGALAGAVGGYLLARRQPDLLDDAWEATHSAAEHARDVAADTIDRARDGAEQVVSDVRDQVDDTIEAGADALANAADQLPSGNGEAGSAAEQGSVR